MFAAKDVMTTTVVTADPNSTIEEIASLLLRHNVSGLPVVNHARKLIGVVSEYDLLKLLHDPNTASTTVAQHMSRDVISVGEDEPLQSVIETFLRQPIRRLPVVRDGVLVGMISRRDIVRVLCQTRERITSPENFRDWWLRAFSC